VDGSSEPCSDLRAILDECALSYVSALFNNAKITRAILNHMTCDDLESIGIKPGPIAVIMGVLGLVRRLSRAYPFLQIGRVACEVACGVACGVAVALWGSATCNYGTCELYFESGLVAKLS
jgi:hypothetical protein